MSTEKNKDIVHRFVRDVLNGRNLALIDDLVDSKATEELRQALSFSLVATAIPDYQIQIKDMVSERGTVAVLSDVTGIQSGDLTGLPGTGRRVSLPRIDVFQIANGKIVNSWASWNHANLLDQLSNIAGGVPAVVEPVLEVQEIQGNSLAGFNKDYQTLLFLQIVDANLARAWLREIEPEIATLEEVTAFNQLYKAIRRRRGRGTRSVRATWINIAFSFPGLVKLGVDAESFTEAAFKEGIAARSALLGDPTDRADPGHPDNWVIGSADRVPDMLLILASDQQGWLSEEVIRMQQSLNPGVRLLATQPGASLPFPLSGHEHFGFKDGASQPGIRGRLSAKADDLLTARRNPANPQQGRPGQDLVWPGEFVFGYPKQDPTDSLRPGLIAEAGPTWARNGSFLVFRRLRQDVAGFQQFLHQTARRLTETYPELEYLTPELLGAKLFGRWASGTPLSRAPEADISAMALDDCAVNHFRYLTASQPIVTGEGCSDKTFPVAVADDPGYLCPHASHIRKAYPRDDLRVFGSEAAVNSHRLLRRGIPFGAPQPSTDERGLLFLAYQTSFERQFEFVTRFWLNEPNFRDDEDGHDPIVGRNAGSPSAGTRRFALPLTTKDGRSIRVNVDLPNDWVTVTGGGYFFAPSLSALREFAS